MADKDLIIVKSPKLNLETLDLFSSADVTPIISIDKKDPERGVTYLMNHNGKSIVFKTHWFHEFPMVIEDMVRFKVADSSVLLCLDKECEQNIKGLNTVEVLGPDHVLTKLINSSKIPKEGKTVTRSNGFKATVYATHDDYKKAHIQKK